MNIDDSFYSLLNSAKHKDGSGLTSSERWTPKVKKVTLNFQIRVKKH